MMKRRSSVSTLVVFFFLYFGSYLGFYPPSPELHAQEHDQINETSAEPADAVRGRIAGAEKLLGKLPDRGAVLYYMAALKQHLGQTRDALKLLKECLTLREGFDPSGSTLFRGLVSGSKEFEELVASVHRDFPVTGRSHLALVTEEKDLVPEGLAYDARRNVYYLSSLNRRKIVQITAKGVVSDFVPAGRDRLLPVLGIRPDPTDSTGWANSWSEDTGQSELLHFDASGKLLERYSIKDTAKHGFNDLVVRKSGEVILTDSLSHQVFRFDRREHAFAPLPIHRLLFEPNGIALSADNRQLFVADDFGVVRVNLDNGSSADIEPGPRNTLAGADGLYWHKGSLIAIQNAIGSPRIASFRLSKDGSRVTRTLVLESRSTFTEVPTTGAIHGNDFYFIINSQGDNMNGDTVADPTKLEPVRIGVLRLP